MPRKFAKKGLKKSKSAPRRRLQPAVAATAAAGGYVAKKLYNRYMARQLSRTKVASSAFNKRVEQSDNITTVPSVVVGKQKPISFQEKVSRSIRPPLIFKRNYGFNVECVSGRKAMFSMDINVMVAADLNSDLTTYKLINTTDTSQVDPQIQISGAGDSARYYVDKLTEKIQMVNSSSNSIIGKVHLFAHKRDTASSYNGVVPINPINMLMYYSTLAPTPSTADAGGGQVAGNGWVFSNGGGNSGTNYNTTYNMPGSALFPASLAAAMDPTLDFTSAHVKDGLNFWFRKVSSANFSLKPGQQFNSSFIFNDLPVMTREEQVSYVHLAGVSYSIVVEFKGGIVGDSTAVTGDGIISTGTCQLSVIRENQRVLGLKNALRSKFLLQTAPLTQIAIANQVIINADTGVGLSGTVIDS